MFRFAANILLASVFALGMGVDQPAAAESRLPGFAHLMAPVEGESPKQVLEQQRVAGELLLSELRCGGCHSLGPGRARSLAPAPPLTNVASRVAAEYLQAFLADPQATRPGTLMPHVLAQLPAGERNKAAEELTHHLLSLAPPDPPEREWGDLQARDEGRALFSSLGCVACHGSQAEDMKSHAFVPLSHLSQKTSLASLKQFLADPQAVHPGSRMPNFRLREDEQHALAMYLLRERLPNMQKASSALYQPGVRYEYFEGNVREGPPEWAEMRFIRRGTTDRFDLPSDIRPTKLALRFTALIDVPAEGTYAFFTQSNDGSELWVDRRLVVSNHGFHGNVEASGTVKLTPGLHSVSVAFWQDEGTKSLTVAWQPPGAKKAPIPAKVLFLPGSVAMRPLSTQRFEIDPGKAEQGKRRFAQLGCANCHQGPDVSAPQRRRLSASALQAGCLSATPSEGAPFYDLEAQQKQAIAAALKQPAAKTAQAQALLQLATHNCLACHERQGRGGPSAQLNPLFTQSIEVDLGDEGRLPPSLTNAGAKLRPEAILRIVGRGELHVRPYMAARMPSFPLELAADLSKLLASADGARFSKPPKPSRQAFEDGRRLLGTANELERTGFGCINCHNVAGRPATGSPGPDLELAPFRLNYAWFDKWLAQPQSMRSDTRMPAFWGDQPLFADVAGGSGKRQRAAIWAYLSRGATPLPEGLVVQAKASELLVASEPIVYRTFMKDVGPRAIVVGNPESVHVAFDANVVRLAKAWRGRFWDPSGTWTGRSGSFNEPLGDHVLDMPPGPAFAVLPAADAPWPKASRDTRNLGGRFLGYQLDAQRRPVFRYQLDTSEISEMVRPKRTNEGFGFVRAFTVLNPKPGLLLQAGLAKRIQKRSEERYMLDDVVEIRLAPVLQKHAFIRAQADMQQLLVRVPQNARSFDVEVRW